MTANHHTTSVPALDQLPLTPAMVRDLRSDHAGEIGAVEIYRGILAVSRDPAVREFARHHAETERQHREFFDRWLPRGARTRARPLWRLAGWLLGAVAALSGRRGVYHTIAAVESFVDGHYAEQIEAMSARPALESLRAVLVSFREDELEHRDDAAVRVGAGGVLARTWAFLVGAGSSVGVLLARRL